MPDGPAPVCKTVQARTRPGREFRRFAGISANDGVVMIDGRLGAAWRQNRLSNNQFLGCSAGGFAGGLACGLAGVSAAGASAGGVAGVSAGG